MTEITPDIVVVGAGHNGLIAAAYLAKAGRKVLVLERQDYAGGGVHSDELTEPGYTSERHAALHVVILANPLITDDELGLFAEHGLEYIPLDKPYAGVFTDGTYVALYRDRAQTAAAIAAVSEADAEAYGRFQDTATAITEVLLPTFFVPPVDPAEMGPLLAQHPLGAEIMRVMPMSVLDVIREHFTDDRTIITFARLASEVLLTHPADPGTGIFAYVVFGILEKYGISLPKGGGSNFTAAVIRAIQANGGEVRLGADVTRVLVEDGRATGVLLADGTKIHAREAVVGAIHPHLLSDIVPETDAQVAADAKAVRLSPYTGFVVHASLNEPLRYKASRELNQFAANTVSVPDLAAVLAEFDALAEGRLAPPYLVGAGSTATPDPSRAPEGGSVLHLFNMTTYDLADGGAESWNRIKDQHAQNLLEYASQFFENLTPENIRVVTAVTPLDHQDDTPSFQRGDICGVAMHADQMSAARPTPALSSYRVPGVAGLFLTGPFMHPGGGVMGGGRATAIRVLEDLGVPFGEVVGSR